MDVVFVSAPEDSERIRALAEALGKAGLRSVHERTVPPGETYQSMIDARFARAKAVVVAWSPSLVAAPALLEEAARARTEGKAVAVALTEADPPAGLSDPPLLRLGAWPARSAEAPFAMLLATLRRKLGEPGIVSPSRPRFSRTWKFWLCSLAVAATLGGLVSLSPEGQRGEGFGLVGPTATLLLSIFAAFLGIALARSLLHLSGRVVGRESPAYFSREFLTFLGVATTLCLLLGAAGVAPERPDHATSSFLYGFASLMVVLVPLMALGVGMFRVMRRMLFPRA